MVATVKTWSDDINNVFSSVSVADHYREAFFYLLQTFLSAGWTVTLSCDSVNTPSASNQILSPANVVWGNAAQARSWFVVRSPVGWCSTQIEVMVGAENINTDVSPNTITLRSATSAYAGGSTTTYPAAPTGFQTNPGTSLIFHQVDQLAQWSAWWTADGDIYFGTKPVATTPTFTSFIVLRSDGGFADGGRGPIRALVWVAVGNTTNALNYATINNNWQGWNTNGTIIIGGAQLVQVPADVLTYRNSRDTSQSVTPAFPIFLCNPAATSARYYGIWLDVWAIPLGNPTMFSGEVRDNEGTEAKRLVSVLTFYLPTTPSSITGAGLLGNVVL